MEYQVFSMHNYRQIPQLKKLNRREIQSVEVVGRVLPFKTNNYVVNELIDWNNYQDDPLFILNFPQRKMLSRDNFNLMSALLEEGAGQKVLREAANNIRQQLNPNPAGQALNVPTVGGVELKGVQHKYRETLLFFPAQGQSCHAFCTFCFRWSQFSGGEGKKFAMKKMGAVVDYLKAHPAISDILFTGGDPMIMKASILESYINCLLEADLPHLKNIRIGSKTLSFWPYRYLTDKDADDLLRIFERVVKAGKSLSFMAHLNHPRELSTEAVARAISRIRSTGATIRTQSPLLNHINAHEDIWVDLWTRQVQMGLVPYYMFVARDTGAQEYFGVTLDRASALFREAHSRVGGLCRTVRGPSMSCTPGKIKVSGVSEIRGEKVFVLEFVQGRKREWVGRPFFAKYDPDALWIDDLKPAFGEDCFFFEQELAQMML